MGGRAVDSFLPAKRDGFDVYFHVHRVLWGRGGKQTRRRSRQQRRDLCRISEQARPGGDTIDHPSLVFEPKIAQRLQQKRRRPAAGVCD